MGGGKEKDPYYQDIKDSTEAFMVEFDPEIVTFEEIINEWAAQHEPYYQSKCQYRSAIFYVDERQRVAAEKKVQELSKGGQRKVYIPDFLAFFLGLVLVLRQGPASRPMKPLPA